MAESSTTDTDQNLEDIVLKVCDILKVKNQSKKDLKLLLKNTVSHEVHFKNEYTNKQYFLQELMYNISKLLEPEPIDDNKNSDSEENKDAQLSFNINSNLIGNSWNVSQVSIPSILGETNTASEWWYYVGYVKDVNNNEYSVQMQILRGALLDVIDYSGTILAIGDKKENKYYYSFDPGFPDLFAKAFYAKRPDNSTYEISFENTNHRTKFKYIGDASDDKDNPGYAGLLNAKYHLYSKGIDLYNGNKDALELNIFVHDKRGTVYEGANGNVGNSHELAQPRLRLLPEQSTIKIGNNPKIKLKSGNLWLDRQMLLKPRRGGSLYTGNWMGLFLNDGKSFSIAVFWNPCKPQWQVGSMLDKKPRFSFGTLYHRYNKAIKTLSMPNGGRYLRGYGNDKIYPVINDTIDFDVNVLKPADLHNSPHWQSPRSNNTYCTAWQILFNTIWDTPKTLYLFAMVDGCENSLGDHFWEGAVSIYEDEAKERLIGYGFVEQMGYN